MVIAQRTVRLANVRNGLRRITLRNERDNKSFPLAQVLVNIKVFTTDEIQEEDAKLNNAIEVKLFKNETNFKIFQRSNYEEKVLGLDYNSQQTIKRGKLRAISMVSTEPSPLLTVFYFVEDGTAENEGCSPSGRADTEREGGEFKARIVRIVWKYRLNKFLFNECLSLLLLECVIQLLFVRLEILLQRLNLF